MAAAPLSANVGYAEREGTSAYDAGHAAGKALAVTHAAKPKAPLTFEQQILQMLTANPGPTPAQQQTQAQKLAQADVDAAVKGYQAQQAAARNQAAAQAAQIQAATRANADYLTGLDLPGQTATDFANAALAARTGAQGFSGDLRATADAQAAKVQAGLAAVGAPAGQVTTGQGEQLGNVLYGLGGQIPASVLDVAGPAAASALRAQPAATLGYGAQQAQGVIGQGLQAANALTPDILNAISQRPKLAAQYLSGLQSASADAAAQKRDTAALLSLIQNRDASQALGVTKVAQTAKQNAQTAKQKAAALKLSATKAAVAAQQADQRIQIAQQNAATSYYSAHKPPKASVNAPRGGLTANEYQTLKSKATDTAKQFYEGVAPDKQYVPARYDTHGVQVSAPHWIPVPGTGKPPVQYASAVAQLVAMGPATAAWAKQAVTLANSLYAPGEGGRPKTAAQIAQDKKDAAFGRAVTPSFGFGG